MNQSQELSAVQDALSTADITRGISGMDTEVSSEAVADTAVTQATALGFYGHKERKGKGWLVTAKFQ